MKTLTLSITMLLASSAYAQMEGLANRRFEIIGASNVEVQNPGCIVALRSTISTRDAENRNRFDCFQLQISDAVVKFEDGTIGHVDRITTQPMMELLGTTPVSRDCSQRIAGAMNRYFKGEQLNISETLDLPDFQVYGQSHSGELLVATGARTIRGHEVLGRRNIAYTNRSGASRSNCSATISPPNVQVSDQHYNRPSEDRGTLRNLGRGLADIGREAVRGAEDGIDFIGRRVINR
jgi:hypothetical protein